MPRWAFLSLVTLLVGANWSINDNKRNTGQLEVSAVAQPGVNSTKNAFDPAASSLLEMDEEILDGSDSLTCTHGYYRVNQASEPCAKYQHSKEQSEAAQVWCCNCNQGQQWHDWGWTYVLDAPKTACVGNIYVTERSWEVVMTLACIFVGLMFLFGVLPLFLWCGDRGPKFECCHRRPYLFGCRDKSGCWWRTDSRTLILITFLPFYVVEALAITKYVESLQENLQPRYDQFSTSIGRTLLTIAILTACVMPLGWCCLGNHGQKRGRRHIIRREKNGFTVALFKSWHLHNYFYRWATVGEGIMCGLSAVWLGCVSLEQPNIISDSGNVIVNVTISPSRQDIYALVLVVFFLHGLSIIHCIAGLLVFNGDYFKSKFRNVKLSKRGAVVCTDYCVEEPLIKSLDCDYKKFVEDENGKIVCGHAVQEELPEEDKRPSSSITGTLVPHRRYSTSGRQLPHQRILQESLPPLRAPTTATEEKGVAKEEIAAKEEDSVTQKIDIAQEEE